MTLVVAISSNDGMYMISDTMLTSENKNQQAADFATKSQLFSDSEASIVGLSQKIVKIRDGLFVGWSGSADVARRYIDFIRQDVRSGTFSAQQLRRCYQDYFTHHSSDNLKLSTIIFIQERQEITLQVSGKCARVDVPGLGDIAIIGSGTKNFLSYLEDFPFKKKAILEAHLPNDAPKIEYILSYVARTMNAQHLRGLGLDDGWGASFKIVLSKVNNFYEKLSDVLYHTYAYSHVKNRIKAERIGRRYFHYYINDNLTVLSQAVNEVMKYQITGPPDRLSQTEKNPTIRFSNPQMVCTLLTNIDSKFLTTDISWNLSGHSECSISPMLSLYDTIRIMPSYVKAVIERRDIFNVP